MNFGGSLLKYGARNLTFIEPKQDSLNYQIKIRPIFSTFVDMSVYVNLHSEPLWRPADKLKCDVTSIRTNRQVMPFKDMVQARLEPDEYKQFVTLMTRWRDKTSVNKLNLFLNFVIVFRLSVHEVEERTVALFAGHDDLVEHFEMFVANSGE
jgi:hypothetical protein